LSFNCLEKFTSILQSCSLGLDVSVSRRSRDVFFKCLGLILVSAKCGKVSVSSRTESQTSRSRLGLQRLVYKWTFKHIFIQNKHDSSVGLYLFNVDSFATLRLLALQFFSAPCSSAASERVFSRSGLIMRTTRSRPSPSRLAKLVFLKCNKHAVM